jgi:hypothetical protein
MPRIREAAAEHGGVAGNSRAWPYAGWFLEVLGTPVGKHLEGLACLGFIGSYSSIGHFPHAGKRL